jgi:hypothetical protein
MLECILMPSRRCRTSRWRDYFTDKKIEYRPTHKHWRRMSYRGPPLFVAAILIDIQPCSGSWWVDARNDSLQIRQAGGFTEHPSGIACCLLMARLDNRSVQQALVKGRCPARLRRAGLVPLASLASPCFQRRRNGGQASDSMGRDHRSLEGNQNNFWVFTSVFRRAAIKVNLRVTSSVSWEFRN